MDDSKIEEKINKVEKLQNTASNKTKKLKEPKQEVRSSLTLTQETHERLMLALPKVKIEYASRGEKIDKKTFIEKAINYWLNQHKY